jgi:hypothetical protein
VIIIYIVLFGTQLFGVVQHNLQFDSIWAAIKPNLILFSFICRILKFFSACDPEYFVFTPPYSASAEQCTQTQIQTLI